MGHDYRSNIGYYDLNAGRYESSPAHSSNEHQEAALREELERCVALTGRNQLSVLEIGPGTGYLLGMLVKIKGISYNYTGVDHSTEMTKILLSRYRYRIRNIKVLQASVSAGYIDGTLMGNRYDLILGSSVLHQVPDREEVVRKLSRLLNANGVMFFTREPVHRSECAGSAKWQARANGLYGCLDSLLSKRPEAEGPGSPGFGEGVSRKPFAVLCEGDYRLVVYRRYNRRGSSFVSRVENGWFPRWRVDSFGNTMFSIGIQRMERKG